MKDEIKNDTLHVYGQSKQHDDLIICGGAVALKRLRDLIDKALQSEHYFETDVFYQNDGEGYDVEVYVVPTNKINNLNHAYHDVEYMGDTVGFKGFDDE